MSLRPRTKASKKRRVRVKMERRMKKWASKVMPMLSHPKKVKEKPPAKVKKVKAPA
jgi:hypothetical protein